MPEQNTVKNRSGRPRGAKTKSGQNAQGAGAPEKYRKRSQITFYVEAEVKRKFELISLERGEQTRHLHAALSDYLARPDIRARLTEVQELLAEGNDA